MKIPSLRAKGDNLNAPDETEQEWEDLTARDGRPSGVNIYPGKRLHQS